MGRAALVGAGLLVVCAGASQALDIDAYIDHPPSPDAGGGPAAERLAAHVQEFLDAGRLAPLYVCIGIGGTDLFFEDSAEVTQALCLALPHLPDDLAARVKAYLAAEVAAHPPWAEPSSYDAFDGARRERFVLPEAALLHDHAPDPPHLIGNLYATWLYAETCDAWQTVDANWPAILAVYRDFIGSEWSCDPAQGDLYMNRYLAGLMAFVRIAERHDPAVAQQAREQAGRLAEAIVQHFTSSADRLTFRTVGGVAQIDAFIGEGDPLFMRVAGHRSEIAKFEDLTPEVAAILRDEAPEAAAELLAYIDLVLPGWYLVGEERQVHFGENLMHFPDFSLGIFRAKALIAQEDAARLERYCDMPWCVGDMTYVEKLAWCAAATGP